MVLFIAWHGAGISSVVNPLNQNEIPEQIRWQLVLVMEFTKTTSSWDVRTRGIVWILGCVEFHIFDKLERIRLEAIFSRDFTPSNRAGIEFKVSIMIGSQQYFQLNNTAFIVAFLNDWSHQATLGILG